MNQDDENKRYELLLKKEKWSGFISMFDVWDWAIAIFMLVVFSIAIQVVNN